MFGEVENIKLITFDFGNGKSFVNFIQSDNIYNSAGTLIVNNN